LVSACQEIGGSGLRSYGRSRFFIAVASSGAGAMAIRSSATVGGLALVLVGFFAGGANAALVVEAETDGTAVNNSIATAQAIPSAAFTAPPPANVFGALPTATITGRNGGNDVDFFSFQANAGTVYVDIDNDPFSFDSILALFDSSGTLLAFGDDSGPEDPGTAFGFDSFIGVYTLTAPGTYYVTVSEFSNFPTQAFAGTIANLLRPDGQLGGLAQSGSAVGVSTFNSNGNQVGSVYTLHISLANPTGVVPEPATIATWGGFAALMLFGSQRRRRRYSVDGAMV
jgi:hypothetical protein